MLYYFAVTGLCIYIFLNAAAAKKFSLQSIAEPTSALSTVKNSRSTIECSTWCSGDTSCYGFAYNKSTYECHLLEPANVCLSGSTRGYFHFSTLLARGMC